MKTAPQTITTLQPNQIFVFGSNLAGRHGAGAALIARRFGARYGVGIGPCGQTYAIPTKDERIQTLPLWRIANHVRDFITYAEGNPHLTFLVTPIGCGLAGYSPEQIAHMFSNAPESVLLPECFVECTCKLSSDS